MRKPFVAGNWKMNLGIAEAVYLARKVSAGYGEGLAKKVQVALIPPFLSIPAVSRVTGDTPIDLGAQDVYFEKSGAFTGEISAEMLADADCSFALVGHSERRHVIGETDQMIRKKLDALLANDLNVILCVGEKLEERQAKETEKRLEIQLRAGLEGLDTSVMDHVTIAYEPVWAIGTGVTATTDQAQEAHAFIRRLVEELFGAKVASEVRIQYGGSVKPDNASALMAQPDVDGALVGGAALDASSFLGIIEGAAR